MKKKVTNVGNFRLSPNEEAMLLKAEYERRRKQRLLQVREQERCIALQIRQEVKQRRYQHLHHLAEELKVEWEETQKKKIKDLEKLYVASLRSVGEGHRSAKENGSDLNDLVKKTEERQQRAEERGQEALKKLKNQKEKLLKQKTWCIETRKKVLLEEKERAAKIASLPPPPPDPFEAFLKLKTCYLPGKGENLQVKRISTIKTNSFSTYHLDPSDVHIKGVSTLKTSTTSNLPTYHHLDPSLLKNEKELEQNIQLKQISKITSTTTTTYSTYNFEPSVDREMEAQQPDPHLAAEEETKRLEELQKEAIQERREQLEKAYIRGVHAMRKVHLAKNREKIMKDLEQLQQVDLARRRQNVAQMPPRVVELPYKRMENKEDWQRELEFAFEDMYNADRKVKGDLILKLEPEPLPAVSELIQDEALDISMEQDFIPETQNRERIEEAPRITETEIPLAQETYKAPSETVFKKLLDKIQSQRSHWANKHISEDESEVPKIFADGNGVDVGDVDGETLTVETGTISSEEKLLDKSESTQEQGETQLTSTEDETLSVEFGSTPKEEEPFKSLSESGKKKESSESEISLLDERSVLLHPHEEAARIRTVMKRQKQMMKLEQQKQKQVELIRQIEQQRLRLESDCLKAQKTKLEHERKKIKERTQQFYLRYMKSYPFVDRWKKEGYLVSQHLIDDAPTLGLRISRDDHSKQMIHNYQQHLLQQNRFHRQSIDTARKHLHEYQNMLKQRYPSMSTKSFSSDFANPKGESLNRKTLTFQSSSLLPREPELLRLHLLPTYPAITGDSHLLSLESSEKLSSEQTAPSSSVSPLIPPSSSSVPFAEPESKFGRIENLFSDKIQRLESSSHFMPSKDQKDHLETMQEQLNVQRETPPFSEKIPEELIVHRQTQLKERMLTDQTGTSSLVPLLPQHSLGLSPSAEIESERLQESFSIKRDDTGPSSHSLTQVFPNSSLSFSEDILNQHNNMSTSQKQLNIQKEAPHLCHKVQTKLFPHASASVEEKVPFSQTGSSLVPLVPPCSLSSLHSAKSESGKIQIPILTRSKAKFPSSPSKTQIFQDKPLILGDGLHQGESLNSLKIMREQLAKQREALRFGQKTQEQNLVNKPPAAEEKISSTLKGSFSLQQLLPENASSTNVESESTRIQKPPLARNESTVLSTPPIEQPFQVRLLTVEDHPPQQEILNSLKTIQEQLTRQREALHFCQKSQEQNLVNKPASVEEEKSFTQTVYSARSQERCLTSKLILAQQDKWKVIEEQSDIQRVPFHFNERTQKEERVPSSHTGLSSLVPLFPQSLLSSLHSAKSESGGIHDSLRNSEPAYPSNVFVTHTFQDKLLTPSECMLPQQQNQMAIQEPLNKQRETLHYSERTQDGLWVCPKTASEERLSPNQSDSYFMPLLTQDSFTSLPFFESGDIPITSSHPSTPNRIQLEEKYLTSPKPILPQQGDLNLHQEPLATERKVLYFSERDQQQTVLDERLFSGETDSSFIPSLAQHVSSSPSSRSEEIQNPFISKSESTLPSKHSTVLVFQDRISTSGDNQFSYQQDNLKAIQEQLNIQKEALYLDQRSQSQCLDYRLAVAEERTSSSQSTSSPFLPQFPLLSANPLPSVESESKSDPGGIQEPFLTHQEIVLPSSQTLVHTFQDKLLASSKHFSAAQDNLKELQKQLNIQKKIFIGRQKAQEEWLFQRQTGLKDQVQKFKELLKDSLHENQVNNTTVQNVKEPRKTEQFTQLSSLSQDIERNHQEELNPADKGKSYDSELLSENISPSEHTGELQNRELRRRLSKPPVAKVRSGLDLNQHELSAIQEIESPKTARAYTREQRECYGESASKSVLNDLDSSKHEENIDQHRDPVRISVSQDLSLGDRSQGQAKDVISNNRGLLSYTADLEQEVPVSFDSAPKPRKIMSSIPWSSIDPGSQSPSQEQQHDQSSSLSASTGSFLSNEKSHLNLGNADVPDLTEIGQSFPHLHHQLFHPLEPNPDSDFSSSLSQSRISPDLSKTTYPSTPESQDALGSHESTTSTTALRASLHSSPDINLHSAMRRVSVTVASPQNEDFPKESIILAPSEESFHLLQPESIPSDRSHSADLLSIISIEAEGPSQDCNNQNFPLGKQDEELVTQKRSADASSLVDNMQSPACSSSDDPSPFDRIMVPHSTPYDSSSSKSSKKDQLESRNENLVFEELSNDVERSQTEIIACARSETSSKCLVRDLKEHSDRSNGVSTSEENVEIVRNTPQPLPSSFLMSLRSCSLQTSIPIWETESGQGIMEEAELTLITSSDSSVADSDLENLIQEENKESELKSSFQVEEDSGLKEVYSVWKSNLTVTEPPEEGSSSSFQVPEPIVSDLKKVNEVKVCFPQDRKTAQVLMHQQALRLYNQLAEVRQQKEEKARQEAYARNREKAKEFHRERESEHSITEEDGLTLISSGVISSTDLDLGNWTRVENKASEIESHFQMKERLSPGFRDYYSVLTPEVPVAQSSSFQFADPTVSELKNVNEVKVCFSEDRKIAQAFMNQQALRVFHLLTEVKREKEEKLMQEQKSFIGLQ